MLRRFLLLVLFAAAFAVGSVDARAEEFGYAAKRPVIGGACMHCPWGALADVVKMAMTNYGYDVQVCYSCSRVDSPRIVAERRLPPPITDFQRQLGVTQRPTAPVDFGVSGGALVTGAYEGTGAYKEDGPHKNLRLIANIDSPSYTIIAVKKDSDITDLAQLAARKKPLRILKSGNVDPILDYYGLNEANVKSWGGKFEDAMAYEKPDFDVLISSIGTLSNFPEGNVWYEMSQKYQLRYLEMAPELREKMAKDFHLMKVEIPFGYLRGVDRRIPTVGASGTLVYGRDDMPETFAYDVARALNEHRDLLKWAALPFSYDSRKVAGYETLRLHPGAERYYREVGYIK